jgi:DMSO/TMAO reductase YedYZ molybdopterin-dependent catalytic subunit
VSAPLSRRKLAAWGLTAAGSAAGLGIAARLANRYGIIPPDWGGKWGPGETLTYACQRILTSGHSLAREFTPGEISQVAPVIGRPPKLDTYQRLLAGAFAHWRLTIDGLVARPASFSLADLRQFPSSSQITEQICEAGWSFIAQWTGVPLSYLMHRVGVLPQAKYVAVFSFDGKWDSLDMQEAWQPQTLIAYGMNGQTLPPDYGAPARLKVPRQLGYKNVKFLARVMVTDTLKNIGKGLGSWQPEHGYSWYAGI